MADVNTTLIFFLTPVLFSYLCPLFYLCKGLKVISQQCLIYQPNLGFPLFLLRIHTKTGWTKNKDYVFDLTNGDFVHKNGEFYK